MLVLSSENGHRNEYTGIGSTQPSIIGWYDELSSLSSRYIYIEVEFDGSGLEGNVL